MKDTERGEEKKQGQVIKDMERGEEKKQGKDGRRDRKCRRKCSNRGQIEM